MEPLTFSTLSSLKTSADLDFGSQIPLSSSTKSKKQIRQIFDNISLGVISFLEKHNGVTDVKFFERQGCTNQQIYDWEAVKLKTKKKTKKT